MSGSVQIGDIGPAHADTSALLNTCEIRVHSSGLAFVQKDNKETTLDRTCDTTLNNGEPIVSLFACCQAAKISEY